MVNLVIKIKMSMIITPVKDSKHLCVIAAETIASHNTRIASQR
jgi:hypothetical protein